MKKAAIVFISFVIAASVLGQEGRSWSVLHNQKKLFSATQENEQANTFSIRLSDLDTKKHFLFSFIDQEAKNTGKWVRTFGVYNETDQELVRKNGAVLKLPDTSLQKMLLKNKTIKVFTWTLPKDPKEAARVRVRRVHLCTILLKQ